MRNFYLPLGFDVTHRQIKPNPNIAFRREGLELHYFGMDGFKAEDSHGCCLVLVEDTETCSTRSPPVHVRSSGSCVLADSKGDVGQAAKILTGALSRDFPGTTAGERVEALGYLAELFVRLDDVGRARELLDAIDAVELSQVQRQSMVSTLEQAAELRDSLTVG